MPPFNPKSSADAPWNAVTVQRPISIASGTDFSLTAKYLGDALKDQLNLPTTINLHMRIMSIDLYDLAARPFEVRSYNYTTTSTNTGMTQLGTVVAWPGRDKFTRARLTWPLSVTAIPVSDTLATSIVLQGSVAANTYGNAVENTTVLLMRARILWRPVQTAPASMLKALAIADSDSKKTAKALSDSGIRYDLDPVLQAVHPSKVTKKSSAGSAV